MKYLLQALESRQARLGLTEQELKQLLNDVQEGRETKGSDDWYESLEKVVNELRTTPDAHWFLKPVSKKDVRDYHLVVKNPMDLGTVLKKVKTRMYKTKAEFKDDLDLIWDNCLLYNSSPTHPIRNNAIQMKRKADHHLEFLVDAATSQKDPLAELDFKDDDDSEDEAAAKKLKLANGTSKAVKVVAKREKDARGRLIKTKRGRTDSTASQTSAVRARSPPLSTRSSLQRTAASMAAFQELDHELADSPYPVAGPSRIPAGPPRTASKPKKPTVALKKARHSLRNVKSTPWSGSEQPAVDPAAAALALDAKSPATSVGEVDDDLDGRWWKHVQADDMLRAGVPPIQQMAQDFHRRRRKGIGPSRGAANASELLSKPQPPPPLTIPSSTDPPPTAAVAAEATAFPASASLSAHVFQNIATLQKVQRLHAKLSALDGAGDGAASPTKRGGDLPELPSSALEAGAAVDEDEPDDVREARRLEVERRRRLPVDPSARLTGRPEVSTVQAMESLQLFAGTMLAHAGFEGGQQAALDTITDVATTFLTNLGKTLRFYADTQAHKMTAEEMVLHTLRQNGTKDVGQLERYVYDDVERHGVKLAELAKKMQTAYGDSVEPNVIEDDMLFAGDGEMFMSNFAEDLGEDFFGFRELGLDKELGLASFSVPSRLFHGQGNKGVPGPLRSRPEPLPDHPPPPDFVRFALSDLPLQIGLLRPFYEAEFRKLVPAPSAPPPSTAATTGAPPTPATSVAPTETPVDGSTAAPTVEPSPSAAASISQLPTPAPEDAVMLDAEAPDPPLLPPPPPPPAPSFSSLPPSTTLPEDHFDPVLLKKLGTLAQIPTASSATSVAAKRKKEAHAAAQQEARIRREGAAPAAPKKKSKATGVGKGNWKRPPKDPNAPSKTKRTPNKSAQKAADAAASSPIKAPGADGGPTSTTNGATTPAAKAASALPNSVTDDPPPILLNGGLVGGPPAANGVKRERSTEGSPIKRERAEGSPIKVG